MLKDYYTPKEVAELLQVSKLHVLQLINSGKITAYNVGRRQRSLWRISEEEINNFLKGNKSHVEPRNTEN